MDDSRVSRGLVPDCTTFTSAAFLNATVCTATTTIAAKASITAIARFHHLRLPQISCSEGKAVQVASVFLGGVGRSGGGGGVGGGDFVLLTSNIFFDN